MKDRLAFWPVCLAPARQDSGRTGFPVRCLGDPSIPASVRVSLKKLKSPLKIDPVAVESLTFVSRNGLGPKSKLSPISSRGRTSDFAGPPPFSFNRISYVFFDFGSVSGFTWLYSSSGSMKSFERLRYVCVRIRSTTSVEADFTLCCGDARARTRFLLTLVLAPARSFILTNARTGSHTLSRTSKVIYREFKFFVLVGMLDTRHARPPDFPTRLKLTRATPDCCEFGVG
jgi:hypothetical protein